MQQHMTDLPDANVWLALVDENHVHHEKAFTYWCEQSAAEIAFCRVTALDFASFHTSENSQPPPIVK